MITADRNGWQSELNYLYPVNDKQGGSNPFFRRKTARWTSRLEQGALDVLGLCNGKALPGTENKVTGHVPTLAIDNRGFAGQDIVAVAPDKIGRRSRSWQSPELFWADRYPALACQTFHALGRRYTGAVVACTQAGKAGTDKNNFIWCM